MNDSRDVTPETRPRANLGRSLEDVDDDVN